MRREVSYSGAWLHRLGGAEGARGVVPSPEEWWEAVTPTLRIS
jgi:hypothetical protein